MIKTSEFGLKHKLHSLNLEFIELLSLKGRARRRQRWPTRPQSKIKSHRRENALALLPWLLLLQSLLGAFLIRLQEHLYDNQPSYDAVQVSAARRHVRDANSSAAGLCLAIVLEMSQTGIVVISMRISTSLCSIWFSWAHSVLVYGLEEAHLDATPLCWTQRAGAEARVREASHASIFNICPMVGGRW